MFRDGDGFMGERQIGVMGLGVMGKNLALNIESRGYLVSVIDQIPTVTQAVVQDHAGKQLFGVESMAEFVSSLTTPRIILMMIPAGAPTDTAIAEITPLLSRGDILIDGGNSFYEETIVRAKKLDALGIWFVGLGVSGGQVGALQGPALMPSGKRAAYLVIEPVLTAICAKVDGEACSTYIGPDGAGHYVKMVHNGIEYAVMQLIGEAYDLLKHGVGMDAQALHRVFAAWNEGELEGYLIEITADIFAKVDPQSGSAIVDSIVDVTGYNGTGTWTSRSALELGVPLQIITESVMARSLSNLKDQRVAASRHLPGPPHKKFDGDETEYVETVRKALYASMICAYTQGFALMRAASESFGWALQYAEIAKIFRGGCIIRARLLEDIKAAFEYQPQLQNLLLAPQFQTVMSECQTAWRSVVAAAAKQGVPIPAIGSALAYYDSYRADQLPANLLQAQRDYFGSHRFERIGKAESVHFNWNL